MNNLITLVIATRNSGKTAEIEALLSGHPVKIKNLQDFGPILQVEEDGNTFDENAYKKASFASRLLGFPVLADDSGLVVEALSGAPGIFSARYGGENLKDEERCVNLLHEMKDKTNRKAFFECAISVAVPTGNALTYEGRCEGIIAEKQSGTNGFGYDPIFYYPPLKKTFADMSMEEKSTVSHRGRALNDLKSEFGKVLIWIRQNMPVQDKFKLMPGCEKSDIKIR